MQLHAVVVDVTEASTKFRYPVARFAFYGQTHDEANGYYQAQLEYNEFLRTCVKTKQWKGVDCEVEIFREIVEHA